MKVKQLGTRVCWIVRLNSHLHARKECPIYPQSAVVKQRIVACIDSRLANKLDVFVVAGVVAESSALLVNFFVREQSPWLHLLAKLNSDTTL